MYLADTNALAQASAELPRGLLKKLIDEEIRRYEAAHDKRVYKETRIRELTRLHARLAGEIRTLEDRAVKTTDVPRQREILKRVANMRRHLHHMEIVIQRLRAKSGMGDIGAWEPVGVAFMENPMTAFVLPISIAVALGLGIAIFTARDEVAKLFPAMGDAAKIAMTVVGISAAFLGIIWVVRIGTDLAGDKKKKADEPGPGRRLTPLRPEA